MVPEQASSLRLSASRLTSALCLLLLIAGVSRAADFNFSGSFTSDDGQQSFFFTLTTARSVTLQTTSYATGGFDPSLAVFDAAGNLIASNQDGGCANVAPNPTTGFCWDAYLNLSLPAGTYQAVVTQSNNVANGPTLSNAFAYTGQGNFTAGPQSNGSGGFWDLSGVQLSSSFGLGVHAADSSAPQLSISAQSPAGGQVTAAYSYQLNATGGTAPYSWSLTSGSLPPGLALSAAGLISGTPTGYGTFTFGTQVSDASNPVMTAGPASFQITIAPQNLQITTSSLPTWVVNNAFSQTLGAVGGYTPLTWSLTGSPDGLSISASGVLTGTPSTTGTFTVPVQVTDSQMNSVAARFTLQVNPPVTITSTAVLPPGITGHAYSTFLFTSSGGATASDVWTLASGAIPGGMTLNSAGTLQGTPGAKGSYAFTVQASDGIQPARQNATLNVYDPLSITTATLPSGTIGLSYGAAALAATGGSGGYTWSSANLPPGLNLSSAGQLGGVPTSGGSATFTVNLADTAAAQTALAVFTISIGYQPLLISTSGNLGGVAVGAGVSRLFSATGGKLPYTWSASGLPTGLAINASGALSGTASAPGNFSFTVQVTDALGTSASVNGTLAVLGLTSSSSGNASTTTAWYETFSATGGTPPYTFSATGIPAGLTFSPAGVLSGIAKAAGTYSVTVQVTDAGGVSVSGTYSVIVAAPSTLSVSGAALSNGTVGTPYSDTLSANGGSAPYNWTIIAGTLPDGLSAGSSGTISGNPTKAGTFSFTARATDATGATASGGVTITIGGPPLTTSSLSSLPNGFVGVNYPTQILTPGGGTPPYTYTLSSGSLPFGISLGGGQISGTPSAAVNATFAVTIADSANPASRVTENLSILVTNPASADLLLSAGSLSFALTTGAMGVPAGASVTVKSSAVDQILSYSATVTPSVSWLDVSGGGNTPGAITVALDTSALNLPASATPYTAAIAVTCISPSPCTDKQTIQVSLTVSTPSPQLTLSTSLLAFSASTNNPLVAAQTLTLQNSGGGSIGIKSVTAADSFVTLSGIPGNVPAGPGVGVAVGINTAGLNAGFYRSTITIASSAGSANVPVTFYYALNDSLFLSPAGEQFTSQAGSGPGDPGDSVVVSVAGSGTVNWKATVVAGAPWLVTSTPTGSSTSANPGLLKFSVDPAAAAALAPQAYYGDIQITSSDAVNSPQDFEVVLNVTAAAPAQPNPVPEGVVFVSSSGAAVAPQQETVFTSSATPLGYQASASTSDGGTWLSVTPATGVTSTASPAQTSIAVNPAKLAPGIYRGGVSYSLPSAAVRTVNITMIVTSGTAAPQAVITSKATGGCTPTKLVPTQTGLTNNFAQPVAWPVPLSIQLVDDCGAAVVNGQMVALFSNGDPPLPLVTTDGSSGIYSGTWTPRSSSSQVTITARASASGFATTTAQLVGQVSPNAAPVLTPHGTLHVFDPLVGGALGPGNIVQIYGANLAAQTVSATNIPLPTSLGGTSVVIGGVQAPLYFVSPGQINAQVPFTLTAGTSYQVLISANGALTTPDSVQISSSSPGIAAFASGQIIAQHLDGSLVTETAPVAPGEYVVFYMAGLGLTDNSVVTGAASPGTVLARPLVMPTLTLNGENVPILFAGLTPGLVGLYQVNFQAPADAANGDLSLVVWQAGVPSNTTVLPVHK